MTSQLTVCLCVCCAAARGGQRHSSGEVLPQRHQAAGPAVADDAAGQGGRRRAVGDGRAGVRQGGTHDPQRCHLRVGHGQWKIPLLRQAVQASGMSHCCQRDITVATVSI